MLKHKHHIIPKHMGGTDDPSNLVELTVEEHAEAHRVLYEQHGRKEDWLAWQGLSGQIGKEQILKEIYRENGRKASRGNIGRAPWNKGKKGVQQPWNKGLSKEEDPRIQKYIRTGWKHKPETIEKLRIPKSEETKRKLSESVKKYHQNKRQIT